MPDDIRGQHIAVYQPPSMLSDAQRFEFGQRVANLFANSQLVPPHLRGKQADCFIALHLAEQMREDPLMVLQNIFIVNSRAGWSAQYMISRANRSGIFRGRLRWRSTGTGDNLAVTCFADLAEIDDPEEARVDVTVSMAMARAEGWTSNKKYQTIPEQMLRWRSATWLIRLYAPEVMTGLPTADELVDTGGMVDVTPPHAPESRPRIEDVDRPRRSIPRQVSSPPEPAAQEQDSPAGNIQPEERGALAGAQDAAADAAPAGDDLEAKGAVPQIVDADGEIHTFDSMVELRLKWDELFESPMSTDQIIGMWEDNKFVRETIYKEFGSAAMDKSFARYKAAATEKRLQQPSLLPTQGEQR